MPIKGRLKHVVFVQEKSNSERCPGVLSQRDEPLFQGLVDGTEVQTKSHLERVLSFRENSNCQLCLGGPLKRA